MFDEATLNWFGSFGCTGRKALSSARNVCEGLMWSSVIDSGCVLRIFLLLFFDNKFDGTTENKPVLPPLK